MATSSTPFTRTQTVVALETVAMRVGALEQQLADKLLADAAFEGNVEQKLERLVTLHTQIRVLVAVAILAVGALLAGGQWIVKHAVTDALIERGVIRYSRNTAP